MALRRVDTEDGSRGVYDGDRWVATFKRVADLDDYLVMRDRITALEAALAEANRRLELKRKHGPVPRSECDLCQEPVDPSGSDWQWVEDSWSLACLKCLARIRQPLEQALAERARERDEWLKTIERHGLEIGRLTHERTEDRAAIRALVEHITRMLQAMPPDPRETPEAWLQHSAAIARASQGIQQTK